MITVSRLNGKEFSINPFLIETVEENPDTVIVLNSGKKMVIKESAENVRSQFSDFIGDAVAKGIRNSKG